MGIYYKAAIFVGLPRNELSSLEFFEERIDDDVPRICSPYYDGDDADYAIVGFAVYRSGTYCASELNFDQSEIDKKKIEFKELTGLDAKVFLSPYGY